MADEEAQLLAASRAAFDRIAKDSQKEGNEIADGTDVIMLDEEPEIPTKPSKQANKAKSSKSKGKSRAQDPPELVAHLESVERDGVIKERKPSKRQVKENREKSAGKQWFDMPAFPGSRFASMNPAARTEYGRSSYTGGDARAATEKEMRRQVMAIRLRNALDPKRFYRSGAVSDKDIPKYAQLGRIIGGGLEPASTLSKKERASSVVGELVHDSEARSYSKRKFGEVCVHTNTATRAQRAHCEEPSKIRQASAVEIECAIWHPRGCAGAQHESEAHNFCACVFYMPL